MRRFIAISLLLLFGLPLIAPALALDMSEGSIPACCRRGGKHHCAMPGEATSQQGHDVTVIAEKCPCTPAVAAIFHFNTFAPQADSAIFAAITSHPAIHAQTEAQYRISFDRSRQKRGPPSLNLL
ncbi:MAG TPA: hypothetical protein VHT24_00160 [Pseudacidobacterium sp.]|nr:hypothetical protein [Pseudacidobacterium sp.]